MDLRHQVFRDIEAESERALKKHGYQRRFPDIIWAAIANEEAGEATKDALDEAPEEQLYAEVIQAATMFCHWAEALQQRGTKGWRVGWEALDD